MNPHDPSKPWLESDEWQGNNGILGNRRGFEQLRECIDLLLDGNDDLVVVKTDDDSVKVLKLMDRPDPQPRTMTLVTKLQTILIIAILIAIPILALYGLAQLLLLPFR